MNRKVVIGIFILIMLVLVTAGEVVAKEQQQEREKNILIANINAMRNQEVTVNVLQQLLNRELTELRRMQAVFCDQYGLSVDKWRQGLYEYNAGKGKFVEKER